MGNTLKLLEWWFYWLLAGRHVWSFTNFAVQLSCRIMQGETHGPDEMISIITTAFHHCFSACKRFHFCTNAMSSDSYLFIGEKNLGDSLSPWSKHQSLLIRLPVLGKKCKGILKGSKSQTKCNDQLPRLTDQDSGHDFIKQMQTWWRRTKQSSNRLGLHWFDFIRSMKQNSGKTIIVAYVSQTCAHNWNDNRLMGCHCSSRRRWRQTC